MSIGLVYEENLKKNFFLGFFLEILGFGVKGENEMGLRDEERKEENNL